MNVQEWLDLVAYKELYNFELMEEESEIYRSKFDGSYITHVGMEDNIKYLADKEITEELTHGVGFSKKDNKWYGWSHRAIYGFTIGSTCKKGDCHYKGSTLEEQEAADIEFWKDENIINVRNEGITEKDGERSFNIKWEYSHSIENKELRNTIGGCQHHIESLGKGEWVAETMEDAKQMAIDFNEGVS